MFACLYASFALVGLIYDRSLATDYAVEERDFVD